MDLRNPIIKTATKVLGIFILASILFTAGRFSVRTKTEIKEVVKEVKVTLDETKLTQLRSEITSQIREDIDSTLKSNSLSSGKSQTTSITKITETTKIIERDPITGKVVKETETKRNTDDNNNTSSEASSNTTTESTTKKETTTNTTDTSNTSESIIVKKTEESKETSKETKTENIQSEKISPLGIAINTNARPVITYEALRLFKYSTNIIAEININKPTISAAGVAITADINKHGDYFVGGYGQYNFKDKEEQYGVLVGRRF